MVAFLTVLSDDVDHVGLGDAPVAQIGLKQQLVPTNKNKEINVAERTKIHKS